MTHIISCFNFFFYVVITRKRIKKGDLPMEHEIITDAESNKNVLEQRRDYQPITEKNRHQNPDSTIFKNPIVLAVIVWITLCIIFVLSCIRP